MALDDLDERFATAVKLALGASRTAGNAESDAGLECPPTDMIASYYEYTLNRAERARLEEHFSGCARCQGTLAALLRTAPAIDSVSEAAGSAASAARRPAAQSAGIRERWFESRPAWRIAGLTAVAAAMLAVVVVAGLHLYESRIGQESEQLAALSPAPGRDHRQRSHPAPTASSPNASSGAELALNDKKSAYKSLMPPAPAEPRTATAPSAAAPGAPSSAPANAPAEAGAPAEEVAPPIAPSSAEQNGAAPASAAQAAAALGALAATPAPAATALSRSAAPSVAAAPSAAAPSVAAPATGAVAAGAVGAGIAAKAAAPPASQTMARAAPPAAPGAVNETQRQLEKVSPTTPSLQQPERPAVTQAPANASKVAPAENSRQSASVAEPAPTADVAALARKRAQQQLAKEQLAQQQLAQQKFAQQQLEQDRLAEAEREAEMTRKAELARKAELERKAELARKAEIERKAELDRRAELARKAEQAKRNADLKRKLELANREAQARQARPASSITPPRNESASTQMQVASAPHQSRHAVGSAGLAIGGASAVGQAQTGAPIAASPGTGAAGTGSAGSGNVIARAEPPIYSAPVVAKFAPGIPVAPHAILISPPDHSVYWSLQNSGLIYHTSDRRSWTPESTGVQAEFLAGMAPSSTVCWAVGRKGVILLTTDGTHWERINSPTASDVIGIVAASKDVATIFTAGGVNYSTFDGGSNWEQAN